jgi:hypothetical protein
VAKQNMKVSMGFIHFLVKYFFRMSAIRVLTLMKRDPKQPPPTPRMIAAGKSNVVGITSFFPVIAPNFRADESYKLTSNDLIEFKVDNQKLATAQETKTFQIMLNFQNVLGLDIS